MAHRRRRIPRSLQLGPLPADPGDIVKATVIMMMTEIVFGGVLAWVVYVPWGLGPHMLVYVILGVAGFLFATGFLGWLEYIKLRGRPGRPRV